VVEGIRDIVDTLILQDDVKSVDNSRNVTQNCQEDVDKEIGTAASLEEDTKRRKDDGKNDLADVACGEGHFWGLGCRGLKLDSCVGVSG